MFLQVFVYGGCLPLGAGVSASGSRQTPPRQTTPRQTTPKRTPTDVPSETATAVDGMHPTGIKNTITGNNNATCSCSMHCSGVSEQISIMNSW